MAGTITSGSRQHMLSPRWPDRDVLTPFHRHLPSPYLIYIGGVSDVAYAKTGAGVADWAPDRCVGEWRNQDNPLSLGLPLMEPGTAAARGARAMIMGAAPIGGTLIPEWRAAIIAALTAGLDIISGLHTRLDQDAELRALAQQLGRALIDVRVPPADVPIATGRKRSGRRVLTVGTDCAIGKKYTALALAAQFQQAGIDADFRATGQTGIMISGSGIPIDAVVADFVAGAAEVLSPAAAADHWDVIEGQGSLFHPAYSGVALGLLHGSQPDVIVLCHQPTRTTISGFPDFPLPDVARAIEVNLTHARLMNPQARCAGISLNTTGLDEGAAHEAIRQVERTLGLPAGDPLRRIGFERVAEACL